MLQAISQSLKGAYSEHVHKIQEARSYCIILLFAIGSMHPREEGQDNKQWVAVSRLLDGLAMRAEV